MDIKDFDVLIIGGGLVGASQAIALANAGIHCCIIDKIDPRTTTTANFDGRASAIALSTKRMLETIGVWHYLDDNPAPILGIRVSDKGSPLHLHFDHNDLGVEPFGFIVENRYLRYALSKRIKEMKNITFLAPSHVINSEHSLKNLTAHLNDGQTINAKLKIAADGRSSSTRKAAGITVTKWPYNQSAIVCSVSHEYSHNFIAHERFLPNGPFAILPLNNLSGSPGTRSSIVWTEETKLASNLLSLSENEFKNELDVRFGNFLGHTKIISPKWSYPLSFQVATKSIETRLALIGDASHGMHPIAGQGLNMGLRDVAALSEEIVNAKNLGLDIGSDYVLQNYQRWRKFDNSLMLASTDVLNRLFSNNLKPIALARNLGLAAVNKIPPLKKILARHAMGLTGELPRLMRNLPL